MVHCLYVTALSPVSSQTLNPEVDLDEKRVVIAHFVM
jgi:hypothetical protein